MKARPVKKLDPSRSLGENAARIVKLRLDEMLGSRRVRSTARPRRSTT